MQDILQFRITPDEFGRLRRCQAKPREDCHAAFTVRGPGMIWPAAIWGEAPAAERINVRGWFELLDEIADEFLIWWPKGGCCFVSDDGVRYRAEESGVSGILFLQFEIARLRAVAAGKQATLRASSAN